MSETKLTASASRIRLAFRAGPIPKRIKKDAAGYYGYSCEPTLGQLVAYVRHNYTNYERVCKRHPISQLDHFEFRNWVNEQIIVALKKKATRGASDVFDAGRAALESEAKE